MPASHAPVHCHTTSTEQQKAEFFAGRRRNSIDTARRLLYRPTMGKKIVSALVLLSGFNAFAGGLGPPTPPPTMPEPAEFPELLVALAGAGVLVWLAMKWRRRSSVPDETKANSSDRMTAEHS